MRQRRAPGLRGVHGLRRPGLRGVRRGVHAVRRLRRVRRLRGLRQDAVAGALPRVRGPDRATARGTGQRQQAHDPHVKLPQFHMGA